jgi:putative PIN family toxin of toxin-antitoxin system
VRSDPRCVFDTNVLISALLFSQSTPARAFFATLRDGEVLVSGEVVSELNEVLGHDKFARYVTEEERERFLQSLVNEARLVNADRTIRASRDPKDDKFLELAVSGGADCIISGDDDLLSLHPFEGISILTPAAFLDVLATTEPGGSWSMPGCTASLCFK